MTVRIWGIVSILLLSYNSSVAADMPVPLAPGISPPETDPKWNGLGPGIPVANIHTIAVSGCHIYVGGFFTDAGGNPDADYIAMWDGYTWHALGSGCDNTVGTIVAHGDDIYVGGYFQHAGGLHTGYIARWDGSQWHPVGASPFNDHYVTTIAIEGTDVYAGGFEQIFSTHGRVSQWNGNTWQRLYAGPEDTDVADILWYDGSLCMTGRFEDLNGQSEIDNIARWDGTSWHALGAGLNRIGLKMGLHGGDLYVVGEFTRAGDDDQASYVARWDGTAWHHVGAEPSVCCPITLHITGEYLYTAGNYGIIHRCHIPSSTWEIYAPFNVPSYMWVSALAFLGQDMYAGGLFPDAGGTFTADHVARWGQPLTDAAGLPAKMCTTDPPLVLPGSYLGYEGTWSGPGVEANELDPSQLAGWVTLTFTPDNGSCETKTDILIETGILLHVDLPDTWCETGDPIALPAAIEGYGGKWTGEGVTGTSFVPDGLQGEVTLSFNPNGPGCIGVASDIVTIKENCDTEDRNLFMPNIFSPNGDGVNDVAQVITSPDIEEIILLRIYSRWGELIHEARHISSGDAYGGWEGDHAGAPANTGVYIWMAEARFKDGHRTTYSGDITVIR